MANRFFPSIEIEDAKAVTVGLGVGVKVGLADGVGVALVSLGVGVGLVSLGPRPSETATSCVGSTSQEPKEPATAQGLVVTVAGTDVRGFHAAVDLWTSRLFETNAWQHWLPEFAVTGPGYSPGGGLRGLGELHAAGWWGHLWDFREDAAYLRC